MSSCVRGLRLNVSQVIRAIDASVRPEDCKVHLACHNGQENPLDVYFAGKFDGWQARQNSRNFKRPYVIALIEMSEAHRWLFVGLYTVDSCVEVQHRSPFLYSTTKHDSFEALSGRAIVEFARPGRQSYLLAERWVDRMRIAAILPETMQFQDFPGYLNATATKQQLDTIVRLQVTSWKSALSSVSGVYVITDRFTGKLYVGSAYGAGGIWGRWSAYSATGHGHNHELRQLLSQHGLDYAENFQFGILESIDTRATEAEVIARESYWKTLLLTRLHGLNKN